MKQTILLLLVANALICNAQSRPSGQCYFQGFNTAVQANPDVVEIATKRPATAWMACETAKGCMPLTFQPGSPVLIFSRRGEWACGYSADRNGAGPAWFHSTDLRHIRYDLNPSGKSWAGAWTDGSDRIQITLANAGTLHVIGKATWHGAKGVQHYGDLDASAAAAGNRLHLVYGSTEDCVVDMTLLGKFILANDNNRCGGMNVRFWGFWRRAPSP